MSSAGARLQQARVEAGISLAELAKRTKIQVWILEAIERDDFARLPHGIYSRGFLAAFAREVRVDPETVLGDYVASTQPDLQAVQPTAPAAGVVTRRWRALSVVSATAIGCAALTGLLWFNLLSRHSVGPEANAFTVSGNDHASVSTGVVSTAGVKPRPGDAPMSDSPAAAPAVIATPTVVADDSARADRVAVDIEAVKSLWLEAGADGQRSIYRLLNSGDREHVRAQREISLRVGDASALAYSINGAPGRALGGPGEIHEIRITPDNYRTFLAATQSGDVPIGR
jgi:cytoskeletal protein RodZ